MINQDYNSRERIEKDREKCLYFSEGNCLMRRAGEMLFICKQDKRKSFEECEIYQEKMMPEIIEQERINSIRNTCRLLGIPLTDETLKMKETFKENV